jgi:NTP pyrophosphatase (non-canonical NTP hydrolase)
MSLAAHLRHVLEVFETNRDQLVIAPAVWCISYTHEELCELAKVVDKLEKTGILRRTDVEERPPTPEEVVDNMHLEWGQALMDHLLTAHVLGIDPDRALGDALFKINHRAVVHRTRRHRTED